MSKAVLYHFPTSRSSRVHWLINEFEENGLEDICDVKHIDLYKGEQKSEEFLKINPLGSLPAFVDEDGQTIVESGAIILYLGDKYQEKVNLIPKNKK